MLQDYNRTSKGTERIQPWTMEIEQTGPKIKPRKQWSTN
jgi:hypothetical protein